jgi:MFS family permease
MGQGPNSADGAPLSGWRRPLVIAVLLISPVCMALMSAALAPVMPLIAQHFNSDGHGYLTAQAVVTMSAVGVIGGGAIAGFAMDRIGIRPVLYAALAGYAVAGTAGLYLDNASALFATRLALGLFVASLSTCVATLLGAWFTGTERARLLGFQAAAGGAGGVSALLLSGVLGEWAGWRGPFAIYLITLPVLLLAVVCLPKPAPATQRAGGAEAPPATGGLLQLWPLYLMALGLFVCYFLTSLQIGFLLVADGVRSTTLLSRVIAVGVLGGAVCGLFYGRIFARLGPDRTRLAMTFLMALGFLLIGLSSDIAVITLGAVLAGAGGAMISPYINGLLLVRAPLAVRNRALGLLFTTLYVADFLNPLLVAPLRAQFGMHGVFLAFAGALGVALLAMWRWKPAAAPQPVGQDAAAG